MNLYGPTEATIWSCRLDECEPSGKPRLRLDVR